MSQRKQCSYKGCTEKQTPGNISSVTFFQFPRDEIRRKQWMKLSRCENQDDTLKFLCSKHFDERKYVSKNPRRHLLLASAVPYAYVSDGENNDIAEDSEPGEDDQIQVVTSQFEAEEFLIQGVVDVSDFEEVDCYAESTINDIDYVPDNTESKTYSSCGKKRKLYTEEVVVEDAKPPEFKPENNRTSLSPAPGNSNSKNKTRENIAAVELKQPPLMLDLSHDNDSVVTITNPDITTFIFKGEEYIQMPKRIYVSEKTELLSSISQYKEILSNLKEQINKVRL